MIRFRTQLLSALFLAAIAAPAHAGMRDETLCGWVDLEGQYYIALTDANDTYVLSNDVGEVPGIEAIQIKQHGPSWMDPNASESRYCGCVGASFNGAQLASVHSFEQKQISACFNDPNLPHDQASAPAPAPAPTAPVQKAEDKYGAIAYSFKAGTWGFWYDAPSQKIADSKALAECKKHGKGCKIAVSFRNACGAVYAGSKGWSVGRGENRDQAEAQAAAGCSKRSRSCELVAWSCTTR